MTSEPRSRQSYRINPDFVPREPTGADMFSFCELADYSEAKVLEVAARMRESGAGLLRLTRIDDEHPIEPYPNGYWFEGWRDKLANQLPFGTGRPDDNTVSPPLTWANPS